MKFILKAILILYIAVSHAQPVSNKTFEKEEICSDIQEGNLFYDPSKTLYFDNALIYSYSYLGNEGEFWVYHSSETGYLLFDPDDEMIDFVIADTQGNYYIFGDNGHNEKVVTSKIAYGVTNFLPIEDSDNLPQTDNYIEFVKLTQTRTVDQSNILQPNIESEGYKMVYKKMAGQQNVFITESIPLNAYLLYGFNRLDGDVKLPVADLYFVGIFGKNQLVTHIERDNFLLKLENYGPNQYHAEAGMYNYYIQNQNGNWEKQHLPLLNN